jgi:hypothetical protein
VVSESGLLCLKTGVVGKLPMFSGNLIGTIFLFIGNFGIVRRIVVQPMAGRSKGLMTVIQ